MPEYHIAAVNKLTCFWVPMSMLNLILVFSCVIFRVLYLNYGYVVIKIRFWILQFKRKQMMVFLVFSFLMSFYITMFHSCWHKFADIGKQLFKTSLLFHLLDMVFRIIFPMRPCHILQTIKLYIINICFFLILKHLYNFHICCTSNSLLVLYR